MELEQKMKLLEGLRDKVAKLEREIEIECRSAWLVCFRSEYRHLLTSVGRNEVELEKKDKVEQC